MQIEVIETQHLILKKITSEVMDFIFTTYSDEEIISFLGLLDARALAKEKAKWEKGLATHNRSFLYFILNDRATNNAVGWCGYHTWYTDHDRAEIGYGLYLDEIKQKGLMTEAMTAVLAYGFGQMNLHRVEAFVAKDNIPSLKVLEKFHFQKEGVLLEHYLVNGVYEDSVLYSLLSK